jgi:hypothetical protein
MLRRYAGTYVAIQELLQRTLDAYGADLAGDHSAVAPPFTEGSTSVAYALAGIVRGFAEQLELKATRRQVGTLYRLSFDKAPLAAFLQEVRQLEARLKEELMDKAFYLVPQELETLWHELEPFGPKVSTRFKAGASEIREATNCLALGRSTACVFHLMRAMEVAVRHLGKRLGMTIAPNDTWRKITGNMDAKIKPMKETTDLQKRKKNAWEEARVNLHHLGSVWRNNTMHPAKSYTPAQARVVFEATRVAMTSLAAL